MPPRDKHLVSKVCHPSGLKMSKYRNAVLLNSCGPSPVCLKSTSFWPRCAPTTSGYSTRLSWMNWKKLLLWFIHLRWVLLVKSTPTSIPSWLVLVSLMDCIWPRIPSPTSAKPSRTTVLLLTNTSNLTLLWFLMALVFLVWVILVSTAWEFLLVSYNCTWPELGSIHARPCLSFWIWEPTMKLSVMTNSTSVYDNLVLLMKR